MAVRPIPGLRRPRRPGRRAALEPARRAGAASGVLHVRRRLEAELERDEPELFDKAVRDQVISVLVASHETVTSSLVWLLAILSRMPAVRTRVAEEAQEAEKEEEEGSGELLS